MDKRTPAPTPTSAPRRLALLLVILALALAAPAARPTRAQQGLEGSSNQYTQPEPPAADWEIDQEIPETYAQVAQNDRFTLYADPATLAIKVVDRRSGYVWHSGIDKTIKGDRLNKTWRAFAQSGISIDYLDEKAVPRRNSITSAGAEINYRVVDGGFDADARFPEPGIALKLVVRLEPSGVSVEVPFSSIRQEKPESRLGLLTLYPFFGATRTDTVPGYLFLPDGSGALVRFAKETKATNMFYGRYYGADLGMTTELPWDPYTNRPQRISVPVYGVVHGVGQHAYLTVVEQGAPYGEIQAHPAGVITNFNFIHNAFIYNESYFQATNRSGAGVTTVQRSTNAFDVKVHYRFLDGPESSYVGMARSYQQYLVEQGALKPLESDRQESIGSDIPIRLEFLAAEREKILFWFRLIPMTTAAQMSAILDGLEVKNPEVVVYGWQPGGASATPPNRLAVERGVGSESELKALAESLKARGGFFSLYLDPQSALLHDGGYSPRYDLAMSITSANLIGYNRDMVNYYLNVPALTRRLNSVGAGVNEKLGAGLALDGIGSMLYSDFKPENFLNRAGAIQAYRGLLDASPAPAAFYQPNDYVLPYARAGYDIPISSSGYIYTTDTVPFLQIVYAGYLPAFGPALNFSSNLRDDLLRHADFGVYPAYFLSQEPTAKILNTPSTWIYTSSYAQWGDDIAGAYAWLNRLLGPVRGQPVTAREVLAQGVVAVTYANGKQVVVNYTAQPFTTGGLTIAAKDAALRDPPPQKEAP